MQATQYTTPMKGLSDLQRGHDPQVAKHESPLRLVLLKAQAARALLRVALSPR